MHASKWVAFGQTLMQCQKKPHEKWIFRQIKRRQSSSVGSCSEDLIIIFPLLKGMACDKWHRSNCGFSPQRQSQDAFSKWYCQPSSRYCNDKREKRGSYFGIQRISEKFYNNRSYCATLHENPLSAFTFLTKEESEAWDFVWSGACRATITKH